MAVLTIPRFWLRTPVKVTAIPSDRPRVRADHLASAVSAILSPPILATTTIAIAATAVHRGDAWLWASADLVLGVLLPIAYLLWLYRRGLVSDLDVQRREERARPLGFTLAAMVVAVLVLGLASAPALLVVVAAVQLAQTSLVLLISLRWKISVHCAAAAVCVASLLCITGHLPAPAFAVLPLVAWSRIHLHRHTPAQVIGGTVLGALLTVGLYVALAIAMAGV